MTKTWLITGTSSGFGRALTEMLLARGDRVAATSRKTGGLDDLKAQHGDRLWVAPLDVTDTEAVRRVVDRAFAELGRVDVVVNNAGYGLFGAAEEVSDEQIGSRSTPTSSARPSRPRRAAASTGAGRRPDPQLSSEGAGQIAYPSFSLYHTSKWAIEGFVEAVAQEVAPFGIELTIVEPGATRTGFGAGLVSPPPMAVYESTPAGEVRRAMAAGAFPVKGDAVKMARAMIASVDRSPAPRRLTLGSGAYASVRAALVKGGWPPSTRRRTSPCRPM